MPVRGRRPRKITVSIRAWGTLLNLLAPGRSEAMYAPVKAMTFMPATNSLHFVMLDQPQQFNAALDAFLAQ